MTAGGTFRRANQTLPWVLILYAAATLLHFAHNAEYLAQYPNLPVSWSRADVYVACAASRRWASSAMCCSFATIGVLA